MSPPEYDVPIISLRLSRVRKKALTCKKCLLAKSRTKVVFGAGNNLDPPIAFIGEKPDKLEDSTGEPFSGLSGDLLTKMVEALGFERKDVFLTNAVLCRPPGDRDPKAPEVEHCKSYLFDQLQAVSPQTIVILGRTAAKSLLQSTKSLGQLRGKWHVWRNIPVRVTYHPEYLLKNPTDKKAAWEDLQAVQALLRKQAA